MSTPAAAVVEYGVPIPMRDGTVLRADVVRPGGDAPVPVLLLRNPYPSFVARSVADPVAAAAAGFAVVLQSTRGTGESDGEFVPWVHDPADGADTIAWCAAQPWSNGRVGMLGPSYLGHVQLFAASQAPPALAAIAPSVVPSHPYDLTYEGGALLLGSALGWALGRAGDRILRDVTAGRRGPDALGPWAAANAGFDDVVRTTPLAAEPVTAQHFPAWQDWLAHPEHDDWWLAVDLAPRPPVPMFVVTGWWDIFLTGTLAEWSRECRHPASRLLVGPWSHGNQWDAHGETRYGAAASAMAQNVPGRTLAFLGQHLVDRPLPPHLDQPTPVRLFVMGSNTWRDEPEWPPPSTEHRLHLHPQGRLSTDVPADGARPATFTHDPRDPVPTVGGRNLFPASQGGYQVGPVEQSVLDGRTDVLRFVTDPLDAPLTVIGPVSLTLHAATSAASTDWTGKLVDVHPDGRAYNVVDGVVRVREAQPGQVHAARLGLAATAYTFLPGHRIRLDVASSSFPRYDRNPGTGGTSGDTPESAFVTAEQTVFLDALRPSWLSLPVVAGT